MRILLDTNVVLDFLLGRAPWSAEARQIAEMAEDGRLHAHVCGSSVTDIFYVSRKLVGVEEARRIVRTCIDRLQIISVTAELLDAAARRNGVDFEDDVQIQCAVAAGLDAIVTRDPRGFAGSPIPVLSPGGLLSLTSGNDAP